MNKTYRNAKARIQEIATIMMKTDLPVEEVSLLMHEVTQLREMTQAMKRSQNIRSSSCFGKAKYESKMRGIPFKIKPDDVEELVMANCHYCDKPYEEGTRELKMSLVKKHRGYIKGNIVPVCTSCTAQSNRPNFTPTKWKTKWDHAIAVVDDEIELTNDSDQQDVLESLRDGLVNRRKNAKLLSNNRPNECFHRLKHNAKLYNFEFSITYEQVEHLINAKCADCGAKRGSHEPQLIIMRNDSAKGFTLDNIRPGCRACSVKNRIRITAEMRRRKNRPLNGERFTTEE